MMVIDISLDILPLMLRWSAVNDKQISIYIYIYIYIKVQVTYGVTL